MSGQRRLHEYIRDSLGSSKHSCDGPARRILIGYRFAEERQVYHELPRRRHRKIYRERRPFELPELACCSSPTAQTRSTAHPGRLQPTSVL